jgi:diguanylate cyclase (GGDEF)-like protein/PAS domain S-box-containing protein
VSSSPDTVVGAGQSEALLHFLYQLPVALVRLDASGRIDLINPKAASLVQSLGLPWSGAAGGRDLLQALDPPTAARTLVAMRHPGTVVAQLPLQRQDVHGAACHLLLTVLIVAPGLCMLTLEDVTAWRVAAEAQHESDRRYRDLVDVIPAGVVMHGRGSEIRVANREASRLLGLSIDQMMGREAIDPHWRFLREDGTPMPLTEYPVNQVLATRRALEHFVIGIQRSDEAELVWVICNAFPVLTKAGELDGVVVSFTEVTALKQTERQLQASEERYRLVLKGSNDAHWDWDLRKDAIYYSPRWWQMIGREADVQSTDPQQWLALVHPEDSERVKAALNEALADRDRDACEIEYRCQHGAGRHVDVLSRAFILRNEQGQAIRVSGTNFDLSDRKRAEAEIHRLAFNDTLTGLSNRRRLLVRVQDALTTCGRSASHGALLFIDLDRFKELNDTRGHDCGDRVLQQVATRLRACTRPSDTVARLGGDEFVVLLEHLSPDSRAAATDAQRVGQKILRALQEVFVVETRTYHGAASIGITLLGPDTAGVEDLMKQADLAMYRAKSLGGGRLHFFDDSMQVAVEQRFALEADLRAAMQHDELLLHYQVQVNRTTGVTGAEALVRWVHPVRGMVSPGAFIPLAEATGLILPLGHWVLQEACAQLVRWAQVPWLAALTLSVNVSVHQLHDPDFVDKVLRVLAETGANPRRLKLELTESALAQNIDEIIDKMQQLRTQGVMFSLDDFGTGYSSLSYLKRLPLHQLKIDSSFVRDVITDPSDATLARTIVTLAREFGLEVIAEGVETQEQCRFLEDNGCHDYQGYLFGRPVPCAAFEAQAMAYAGAVCCPG